MKTAMKFTVCIVLAMVLTGCNSFIRSAIDVVEHPDAELTYETPSSTDIQIEDSIQLWLYTLELYGEVEMANNETKFFPDLAYTTESKIDREEAYALWKLSQYYNITIQIK